MTTTPHDWPNGDYSGMTCRICGTRFSGPHNAGKCYLHKDEPTPRSEEWQPTPSLMIAIGEPAISQEVKRRKFKFEIRIEELEAEVAEMRRDRERLAWLQSKVTPAFVVGIGSTQNDENEYWYQVIVNDASGETVWGKAAPTVSEAIDAARAAETAAA